MPLPDAWNSRDLPVLTEAARIFEEAEPGQGARLADIANATGLSEEAAWRALHALEDAGLIEVRWVSPARAGRVVRLSGEARERIGLWPSPENALDRMIAALDLIAENTDDEDTKTKAQKFATWLKASASTIGLGVAQAAITGQLPGQ